MGFRDILTKFGLLTDDRTIKKWTLCCVIAIERVFCSVRFKDLNFLSGDSRLLQSVSVRNDVSLILIAEAAAAGGSMTRARDNCFSVLQFFTGQTYPSSHNSRTQKKKKQQPSIELKVMRAYTARCVGRTNAVGPSIAWPRRSIRLAYSSGRRPEGCASSARFHNIYAVRAHIAFYRCASRVHGLTADNTVLLSDQRRIVTARFSRGWIRVSAPNIIFFRRPWSQMPFYYCTAADSPEKKIIHQVSTKHDNAR